MGNFTDMFVQQNEREWVFFVLFCFYSTFKLIDFIKKKIPDLQFLLKNLLTPDLNFHVTRVVKI